MYHGAPWRGILQTVAAQNAACLSCAIQTLDDEECADFLAARACPGLLQTTSPFLPVRWLVCMEKTPISRCQTSEYRRSFSIWVYYNCSSHVLFQPHQQYDPSSRQNLPASTADDTTVPRQRVHVLLFLFWSRPATVGMQLIQTNNDGLMEFWRVLFEEMEHTSKNEWSNPGFSLNLLGTNCHQRSRFCYLLSCSANTYT